MRLATACLRICPNKNRNRDSGCTCGSSFRPRTDLIHCIPSSVFDWIVSVVSFNCGARHNRLYKWERRWLLASRGPLHKNSVGKVTSGSIPVQLAAQKYARTVRRTPAVPRICSVTTRTIKFEIIGDLLRGQVLCAAKKNPKFITKQRMMRFIPECKGIRHAPVEIRPQKGRESQE